MNQFQSKSLKSNWDICRGPGAERSHPAQDVLHNGGCMSKQTLPQARHNADHHGRLPRDVMAKRNLDN